MPQPIPPEYETRDSLAAGTDGALEFRAVLPNTDEPGFDGYILTWDTVDDRGTYFVRGSGKKTLKERGLIAPHLWMHKYAGWEGEVPVPPGKHLSVFEDEIGVRVRVALNDGVRYGAEILSALRFGTPIGLSFGFDRIADRTAEKDEKLDFSVAPDYIKSLPRSDIRAITEWRFWESRTVVFASNAKAKADTVRSALVAELPSLLDAIRAGSLSDEDRARVEQIVAAYQDRAAAGESHGTPPQARRRIDVEVDLLLLELGEAA
jgi:HK97 family phage prohead protease